MRDKDLIEEKRRWLLEATGGYCRRHLDEEYGELCARLVDKMARKRNVPFLSGKMEIWAASVVYALGQINFLFDKSFRPYATTDDICDYFGVRKSTVSNKAKEIRDMFRMRNWDAEFSTQDMRQNDPLSGTIMIDGIAVPKTALPASMQELFRDIGGYSLRNRS